MIGSEPITWNQFDIFDLNRGRVEPEAESVPQDPANDWQRATQWKKMCQTDKTPTQGTSGRDTPVTRVTRISCAKYILCWVEVAKFRLWTPGVYIYIYCIEHYEHGSSTKNNGRLMDNSGCTKVVFGEF